MNTKSTLSTYLLVFMLAVSCNTNNKNKPVEDASPTPVQTKQTEPINCYTYANKFDTITLKLIHVGNSITGTLVYKLNGKDKNMGTIQGSMRKDLLVADYTFMSEGIMSIRQIVFKLEQNLFVEGYGDVLTKNDRVYFENIDSLQFNEAIKLREIDCR